MKQENPQTNYFKIKFTGLIYALIAGVILLSCASIFVSVWQIAKFGLNEFSDYLKYPLLILISLFCIVVVISMLIKSQYVVDKQYLTSYYGFIKSRFPIQQITEMVLDTDTKKLTIRFNEQFITLNMRFDWREAFIRAILDANPNVDYSFTMAENKPQDENK
ncbi:MAG: hypothetical protein E7355_04605 [Clostridiales bacterium]|nr:hypothetical protein [Clostridiales bacterium]